MHMLGAPLEVSMFKQRDGSSVIFSDRCRTRLDEDQLRVELTTKVHFSSTGSHTDELSLTCRESIGEAKELTTMKRGFDGLHTPRQLEMLDTLEVAKDLLRIAVMLAGSPSHEPSECRSNIHDLGYCVGRDLEQLADKLGIRGDNILVRYIGQRNRSKLSANSHRQHARVAVCHSILLQKLVDESLLISTDSVDSKIVGIAHAELPSEPTEKVEIDAPIISDSGIELINKLTAVVADPAVVDILHDDHHRNRVRAAGVDPIAFRHINKV